MLLKTGYINPLLHLNCDLDPQMGITDLKSLLYVLRLTNAESWESEELVLSALTMGDEDLSTQK